MKFLKKPEGKILVIFISFTLIFTGFVYIFFPSSGIQFLKIHSFTYIILVVLFIIISAVLLYLFIHHFTQKIQKEKDSTTEIINRYEALSAATNDAIWDYDMQTEKVFYNDLLLSTFGYPESELANNTNWWENNIHKDDKTRVIEKMNKTLESGKTHWEDEYRFRCKDGSYKIVQDRSFIVRNKENEPIRLIGAMKDVTKLRSLEKEFIKKQLKNKTNLGKTIILSHENERKKLKDDLHEDVNQMLASIKLYMTDLKSELPSETLTASLRHLDDVIKKINKISSTLSSSTFEFFGLTEAITELIVNYKKESSVLFEFNSQFFDVDKIDKEISLLLYRVIENKVALIIENTNTKKINIELTNNTSQAILRISFKNSSGEIKNILNDSALTDIDSKIEMYEGTMKMIAGDDNNYTIEIVF